MPKPYPTTGKPVQPVEPERPPAPPSVLNAVKLMYAGAAASTVTMVAVLANALINVGSIKDAIKHANPRYTAGQVDQAFQSGVTQILITGVLSIGLWLWMARADAKGRSWARIVSTVLFALATLNLFLALNQETLLGVLFAALTWLIGLGAIVLLWRRESSAYFKPQGRG